MNSNLPVDEDRDSMDNKYMDVPGENQRLEQEGQSGRRKIQYTTMVNCNAARERTRSEKVKTLRLAFLELQQALPCIPPDTKLSKLDILVLASLYISHLTNTLQNEKFKTWACSDHCMAENVLDDENVILGQDRDVMEKTSFFPEYMHPVKKWPMRKRLYRSIAAKARGEFSNSHQRPSAHQ